MSNYEYVPHLFIGVGARGCLFTLRETYEHVDFIYGRRTTQIRSFHHFNLAATPDEAFEKAQAHAAKMGLELRSSRENLEDELNAIKRATREEMEARERAAAELQAKWEADRRREREQMIEVINAGFFPFGKFAGLAFEKAELGYVRWMMKTINEFEDDSLIKMIATRLINDYPELAEPELSNEYVGEVGKRMEFEAEVLRVHTFDGFYGRTYLVTLATPEKACLVVKGSFVADVGAKLKFKATIKDHSEYRGQAQTIINRVKVID